MSRFDPFTLVDLPYRVVQNQALEATLFIPTRLVSRSHRRHECPVMVYFHGGGFVLGHRRYEPWFAQWLLDLALAHDAIIIRPDYRLLPESSAADILSDVDHFWRWMQRDLPSIAEEEASWGFSPDLSRILCCGESSGGCLAMYSGLELSSILSNRAVPGQDAGAGGHPRAVIQAVITTYAPLDPDVPELKIPRPRTIMGMRPPPPRTAEALIRKYMQRFQLSGSIRVNQEPTPEMWELFLSMAQQCYFTRLLKGKEGASKIFSMVDRVAAKAAELSKEAGMGQNRIVPAWIIHGTEDTLAPYLCSSNFVQRLMEVSPDTPLRFDSPPAEHLFDIDMTANEKWIAEGRRLFLEKYWP
ncbi:Alpha/Beta hydrolase protein [Ilyonectria destructans]|nr:Alpha/Beta hydrolase protein [Ilyonectria destructans]